MSINVKPFDRIFGMVKFNCWANFGSLTRLVFSTTTASLGVVAKTFPDSVFFTFVRFFFLKTSNCKTVESNSILLISCHISEFSNGSGANFFFICGASFVSSFF
eukprot:UN27724